MADDPAFGPFKRVLKSVYEIDPDAMEDIAKLLEQRGLKTPLSQVVGYSRLGTGGTSVVTTSPPVGGGEGTTSSTFADLATTGPTITTKETFPGGTYLLIMSARLKTSDVAHHAEATLFLDGSQYSADVSLFNESTSFQTVTVVRVINLNPGARTLQMKYRIFGGGGGTATFDGRQLSIARLQ